MKTVIPFLFAFVSLIQFNTARADDLPPAGSSAERAAMQAAINARNNFVRALLEGNYLEVTRQAFDHAVKDLADQLENDYHKVAEAQELRQEWGNDGGVSQFMMAFAMKLGYDDLGDHAPLFVWLEQYFVKLEDKYGGLISKIGIIATVRQMNFALPVVFTPASHRWQLKGQDNRIEYRKHFIPFANLVTYYGSLIACNVVTVKSGHAEFKRFCKPAAEKLQFAMGRYIAPKVSDFIYNLANRRKTRKPVFNREQYRYENADDLSHAIRMGAAL